MLSDYNETFRYKLMIIQHTFWQIRPCIWYIFVGVGGWENRLVRRRVRWEWMLGIVAGNNTVCGSSLSRQEASMPAHSCILSHAQTINPLPGIRKEKDHGLGKIKFIKFYDWLCCNLVINILYYKIYTCWTCWIKLII